jgi:hypothetical protein
MNSEDEDSFPVQLRLTSKASASSSRHAINASNFEVVRENNMNSRFAQARQQDLEKMWTREQQDTILDVEQSSNPYSTGSREGFQTGSLNEKRAEIFAGIHEGLNHSVDHFESTSSSGPSEHFVDAHEDDHAFTTCDMQAFAACEESPAHLKAGSPGLEESDMAKKISLLSVGGHHSTQSANDNMRAVMRAHMAAAGDLRKDSNPSTKSSSIAPTSIGDYEPASSPVKAYKRVETGHQQSQRTRRSCCPCPPRRRVVEERTTEETTHEDHNPFQHSV